MNQDSILAVINLNFQVSSEILTKLLTFKVMGKKNKKKTLESTRKNNNENISGIKSAKKEKSKILKKLLSSSILSKKAKNHERKIEEKIALDELEIVALTPPPAKQKQKIKGGILMMIGAFTLLFIGYFLFSKFFRPQNLAEILPAEKTLALLEVNIDPADTKSQQFKMLFEKYPAYSAENFVKLFSLISPFNYEKEIKPWLGRRMGIALIALGNTERALTRFYFVETMDKTLTEKAFMTSQNKYFSQVDSSYKYQDFTLYQYENKLNPSFRFNATFVNNYLVLAENGELLKGFIDTYKSTKLSDDPTYKTVANNLPQSGLAFGYTHLQKLLNELERDPVFFAEKGQDIAALKPFLNLFSAQGVSIMAEKELLVAQTFTSIDKEIISGGSFLNFNEKYQGKLLNLINEDPVMVLGGHDLTKEHNRLQDIFKAGTQTSSVIFDGVLEAKKELYFGKDVDLKKDLYPLLEGEYAVSIENNFENPVITLFLELSDGSKDAARLEKAMNEFIKTNGIFSPKLSDVTLPDGTKGREVIANPEIIKRQDENHNGTAITTLVLGESGWSIHYALLGDVVVFSSSKENLTKIIDRHDGKIATNLTTTKDFASDIRPILKTADQMYTLKIGALSSILGFDQNTELSPFLLPFSSFTVTKNFFDDGISEIYLIEVI